MNQNEISKYSFLISFSFYLMIATDFLTKIILTYNSDLFYRYSVFPKAIINIILLLVISKNFKYHKHKYIVWYFVMITLSFFGYMILYKTNDITEIVKQVYIYLLYSYFFILVAFFSLFDKETRSILLDRLQKAIINIGVICCFLILIGLFTKIELFRSYDFTDRFGYNGLFLKTSEASYYFIFLISLTYLRLKEDKKYILLLSMFIIFSLFLGTKVIWLFLGLMALYLVFKKNKIIPTIAIIFSITYYMFFRYSIDQIFISNSLDFIDNNWTFFNYLAGGNKYSVNKVEFELFDIFSVFGLIGLIIYIHFIYDLFLSRVKRFDYILIFVLICLTFAGNFFKSTLCVTLLYAIFDRSNSYYSK